MAQKIKASRYNRFVPLECGNQLAFNALTCGLAEMDADSYRRYCDMITSGEMESDCKDELTINLQRGGFIIPVDFDEMSALRASHYRARFGKEGFGLTIVPTYQCNFSCQYCYEDRQLLQGASSRTQMSAETCIRVIKLCELMIVPGSHFGVAWYGGEPLLAMPVVEQLTGAFISMCDQKQATYGASVITNGYLLTHKMFDALIRCRVGFIQVTIDGPQFVHDRRRPLIGGRGSYQQIMRNLIRAVDEYTNISFSLRVNIDKSNEGAIAELFRDMSASNLKNRPNLSLYFGHTLPYARSCGGVSSHCMEAGEFVKWTIPAYGSAMDQGIDVTVAPMRNYAGCAAVGTRSFVIEPTGDISPCWVTVGNPAHRIGTLTDDGIRYNDNYMRWLGYDAFREECTQCDVLPLCMGGCPYRNLNKTNLDTITGQACSPWRYELSEYLKMSRRAVLKRNSPLEDGRSALRHPDTSGPLNPAQIPQDEELSHDVDNGTGAIRQQQLHR